MEAKLVSICPESKGTEQNIYGQIMNQRIVYSKVSLLPCRPL